MATLFNADEIYRLAVDIEEKAVALYTAASKRLGVGEVAAMFRELAGWEQTHAELFNRLRKELADNARAQSPLDPDGEIDAYLEALADRSMFRRSARTDAILNRLHGPVEVLRYAVELEDASVGLYRTIKRLVGESLGADTVQRIIDEEQEHARALRAKVFSLTGTY